MPLMFAFFGLQFPAGLVLYWTTSNALQVAQQTYLLRAGHIGPDAFDRRMAEQRERMANGQPKQAGMMGWVSERPKPPRGSARTTRRAAIRPEARPTATPQGEAAAERPTAEGTARAKKPPAADRRRRGTGTGPAPPRRSPGARRPGRAPRPGTSSSVIRTKTRPEETP